MTATIKFNILRAIIILIFIAAATLIRPSLAQDATSSTTKKAKLQEKVDTRKANLQQKVDTKKENLEARITAMREKTATREAALKAKLQAFKDKRKAEIADRVNTNLNKINQNQTAEMLKHLEKMSALLDKLEARISSGSPDIKDPAVAKTAIAESRAKIAAAIEVVKAQAEKDYTLTVSSESTVKKDAETLRTQLRTDLQAVRKQVIDAKQSVGNAIRSAKSGTQVKEGTSSGR